MSPDELKALQLAETFKKFQIMTEPKRIEHLFNNKYASELCEFFCNYITEDNYVQKDLQEAYDHFEKGGLTIADELELDNVLETDYEGILEIDDEEIFMLQEELEAEEEYMEQYEKLLEKTCANNNEIDNQSLNGEIDKLVVEFNTATEENENLAQSLINIKSLLKQRISELIEEYNKISIPLMEHSVKTFENYYKNISDNLNSQLKNGFSHYSGDRNGDLNNKIMKLTLFDLKTGLTASYQQEIITGCETKFLKASKNALYRYDALTVPPDQLDDTISRLRLEELQLHQNIPAESVEDLCEKLADKHLMDFYTKFNETNHRNLVSLKDQLDGILDNIIHFRNICQFYHSYLKQVIETAGENKSYCYGIFDELEESDSKVSSAVIELNHLIQEYNSMEAKDMVLGNNFIQQLAKLLNLAPNFDFTSLTQKNKDIETELEKLHKHLFNKEYKEFRENIDPEVNNLMSLFKNLQSNCTSQVLCWDPNVIQLSHQTEQIYNDELEKCRNFFTVYNNQKLSEKKTENDRFLWVWFLKNPKKLLKFLERMKQQGK